MAKVSKRKKAQLQKAKEEKAQGASRRDVLRLARNGAIAAAVVGVGSFFMMRSVRAMQAEQDLSRVGQGTPVVVQVHDPQCPTCNALQREARKAMKQFAEDEMLYLVADISQQDGAGFANRYGVPHVTLLLFDGEGTLRETLHGMRDQEELEPILERHFQQFG
ncbi:MULTISPECIES: thioredoxin family protein [unclassified Ruegeria]|uniref:thioredoxin family protein n=1 Tax=unclassified Ruegeria TaxID=2625375 RepID=UPI0014893B22|nr:MULTISPECIES: thioredoxin family protein [unclassified Ruegeria]